MRALNLLFSAVLYVAGNAAAIGLLATRYDGDAKRSLASALILTGIACLIAAPVIRRTMPKAALAKKLMVYAGLIVVAAAAITACAIGIDGILPARDGGQSIGLGALATNADLFGLVVGAATLACRGVFRRPPAETESRESISSL